MGSFLESAFCEGSHFSYRIFLNHLYGLETTSFQSNALSSRSALFIVVWRAI